MKVFRYSAPVLGALALSLMAWFAWPGSGVAAEIPDPALGGAFSEETVDYDRLFQGIQLARTYKLRSEHNPIVTHRFGADPYAMVYGDRVYVYSTNDILARDAAGRIVENTTATSIRSTGSRRPISSIGRTTVGSTWVREDPE